MSIADTQPSKTPITDSIDAGRATGSTTYRDLLVHARQIETKLHAAEAELSKLRAEVEEIRHSNVTLRGAADLNGQLAVAERAAAEKERDLHLEAQRLLGRVLEGVENRLGIDANGNPSVLYAAVESLQAKNAEQAQRIAELMALVGEMKPFVKELIEYVRHQAEILRQIPRAQFEMLEPVAKSLIARADALLSAQPAPGPTDTQRLDWLEGDAMVFECTSDATDFSVILQRTRDNEHGPKVNHATLRAAIDSAMKGEQ